MGHNLINIDLGRLSAKNLPFWEPDLAHDVHYPCYADPCARDVRQWVAAMEKDEKRRGEFLNFALGGGGAQHAGYLTILRLGNGNLVWISQTAAVAIIMYRQSD